MADLQDALQLCLDRGVVLANNEGTRRDLAAALKRESVEQKYVDATGKLVSFFQRERNLQPSGEVYEATANALDALLKEWVFPTGTIPRLKEEEFFFHAQ